MVSRTTMRLNAQQVIYPITVKHTFLLNPSIFHFPKSVDDNSSTNLISGISVDLTRLKETTICQVPPLHIPPALSSLLDHRYHILNEIFQVFCQRGKMDPPYEVSAASV